MTYLLATALFVTLCSIWVNTYRNALPSRPMGRLLHDPDPRTSRHTSLRPR